jgi:hypothetical protein
VIFKNPTAGIALFFVRDIDRAFPSDLSGTQREIDRPKPHLYGPKHDPYEDNYSHTAIAVLKDGKPVTKSGDISPTAKKEFRQVVSDRSLIIRRPIQKP